MDASRNHTFDAQAVAAALRAELRRLGWSQTRLSKESGVNLHTVNNVFHGKKARYANDTLPKLSTALGRPPEALGMVSEGRPLPKLVGPPITARLDAVEVRIQLMEQRLMRIENRLVRELEEGAQGGPPGA